MAIKIFQYIKENQQGADKKNNGEKELKKCRRQMKIQQESRIISDCMKIVNYHG